MDLHLQCTAAAAPLVPAVVCVANAQNKLRAGDAVQFGQSGGCRHLQFPAEGAYSALLATLWPIWHRYVTFGGQAWASHAGT
jgi:hypothetical protein